MFHPVYILNIWWNTCAPLPAEYLESVSSTKVAENPSGWKGCWLQLGLLTEAILMFYWFFWFIFFCSGLLIHTHRHKANPIHLQTLVLVPIQLHQASVHSFLLLLFFCPFCMKLKSVEYKQKQLWIVLFFKEGLKKNKMTVREIKYIFITPPRCRLKWEGGMKDRREEGEECLHQSQSSIWCR